MTKLASTWAWGMITVWMYLAAKQIRITVVMIPMSSRVPTTLPMVTATVATVERCLRGRFRPGCGA